MTANPKIVHDTIRVTKAIIDTVRASSKDSMDLLNKMDSFYNNAWTKLILVITIAFAIIGIVMPVLIQWYQKRELKIGEEKLKEDIKNAITIATNNFTSYVDEQVEKKFNELDKKVTKHIKNLDGKTFHLQARILNNKGDHSSIGSYFVALTHYCEANESRNAKAVIKFLLSETYQLKTFSKEEVKEALDEYDLDYKEILSVIAEEFEDNEIKGHCKELEGIIDSLT